MLGMKSGGKSTHAELEGDMGDFASHRAG